jgi:hypothetical protein
MKLVNKYYLYNTNVFNLIVIKFLSINQLLKLILNLDVWILLRALEKDEGFPSNATIFQ